MCNEHNLEDDAFSTTQLALFLANSTYAKFSFNNYMEQTKDTASNKQGHPSPQESLDVGYFISKKSSINNDNKLKEKQ